MPNENKENIFSKRLKAGKRRTYFFDVRTTKANDYFITLTESKRKFNSDGYERHKIFVYKEDFNKFLAALTETIDYVKTELMPDFDFDAFNHEDYDDESSALDSVFDQRAETTTSAEDVSGKDVSSEDDAQTW